MSFGGLLGFKDDALKVFDVDRPLRAVRKNTALRAPPVWRVSMEPQGLPQNEVALVTDHIFP